MNMVILFERISLESNLFIEVFLGGMSTLIIKEYLGTIFEKEDISHKIIYWVFIIFVASILEVDSGLPFLNLLLNFCFVFVISLYQYKGGISKKILASFSMVVIWAIGEIIIGYIAILSHTYFISPKIQGSILSKLITFVFVMFTKKIVADYISKDKTKILRRQWWLLFAFPICSIGITYFIFNLVSEQKNITVIFGALLSCSFFLPLDLGIFKIYDSMIQEFELQQQNTIYEENLRLFAKEMKLKEETMVSKDLAHDIKKHFLVIKRMAFQSKNYNIVEYLETLSNHYIGNQNLVNSGNFVVDTLINSKYMAIKNQEISYEINVLIPSEVKIDDADMCILLGNALDNAYEAMGKAEVKKINISIIYESGKLKIGIKNTYAGEITRGDNETYLSTKTDKNNHGIGLKLVKKVVEKYDGFLNLDYDKNYFIFVAVLHEK